MHDLLEFDGTEALASAEASLDDALWRGRVAECAIRALLEHGNATALRRVYRNPQEIVVGGERSIIALDVLHVVSALEAELCRPDSESQG